MTAVERNQNSAGRASQPAYSLGAIRGHLERFRPQRITDARVARAAVALILGGSEDDPEILLIRRATRDGDPWSGHIAFPGGRRHPGDADAVATALRETVEEVGVDVAAHGEVIGHLDELRAVARHRPLDLVISPVVCALHRPVDLRLDPREVESAIWMPLSFLAQPSARAVHRRTLDGVENQYPAYSFEGYTIWGLTHRIVEGFLAIVEESSKIHAPSSKSDS